jgi:hypothetical protein
MRKTKKKPLLCVRCHKKKPTNLANVSGMYKNDKKDFLWVCRSCHNKIDGLTANFKEAYKRTNRNKYGRFGSNKPIEIIKCIICQRDTEKNNPTQICCDECRIEYLRYKSYVNNKKAKLLRQKNKAIN